MSAQYTMGLPPAPIRVKPSPCPQRAIVPLYCVFSRILPAFDANKALRAG